MSDEENLSIWQESLGLDEGPHAHLAERLRTSYRAVRVRAQVLNQRIAQDLPDFTVHDMRHVLGVWRLADQLKGDRQLNPLEGYVLGVAILIHDLGMAVAAYPGGLETVRDDLRWRDALAVSGSAEAPPESPERIAAEKSATAAVLRLRHAEHAAELPSVHWEGPHGPEYLVEDGELRNGLGAPIGEVAASHGRSTDALLEDFRTELGAPAGFPSEWRIDALVLGALLRVADAANVDSGRAPAFDEALQQPSEGSAPHWGFQGLLATAYVKDGSLTFTSSPFERSQAPAWWLAYETLRMVNAECVAVDQLLRDQGRAPLAASGVSGIGSPRQLANFVRVKGWHPVDATVHVGDVAALVESLGGEALYGANPWVALRELLQNASDAVEAHRSLGGLGKGEGRVLVEVAEGGDGAWLSVEDDGVGMSERVILDGLLDFGHSFWGSSAMLDEFPGLATTGFQSTGRYGIGFFSAFMLGDRVVVTTRGTAGSPSDTQVLEFGRGLSGRPLLRPADASERMNRPGTRVAIRLHSGLDRVDTLAGRAYPSIRSLADLVGMVYPAAEVDLVVREHGVRKRVSLAGDWRTIPFHALLRRVTAGGIDEVLTMEDDETLASALLIEEVRGSVDFIGHAIRRHARPLVDSDTGEVVGRAVLLPTTASFDEAGAGVICAGGLRASALGAAVAGVVHGQPRRASRDEAQPLIGASDLAAWATDQASLIRTVDTTQAIKYQCAEIVRGLGGDVLDLPICRSATGWMSRADLKDVDFPEEIVLVFESALRGEEFEGRSPVTLHPHVFATDFFRSEALYPLVSRSERHDDDGVFVSIDRASLGALVAEAVADAWGCAVEDIRSSEEDHLDVPTEIGIADGRPFIVLEAIKLRPPKSLFA
jgi:hypothetical protein